MKKDTAILSAAFFLIFLGFNTVQQYFTVAYAEAGRAILSLYALATIYAFFLIGSFIAPPIIERVGLKKAMLLGGAGYVLFIAAAATKIAILVIGTAAINGLCAALLWIGEGAYIIESTEEKKRASMLGIVIAAALAGSFLGILGTSFIVGRVGFETLFTYMAVAAAAGTGLLLFITEKKSSVEKASPLGILALLKTKALLFVPLFFATNMIFAFFLSTIMLHLKDMHGAGVAGRISSVFWLAAILAPFAAGLIAEKIGKKKTLQILALMLTASAALFLTGKFIAAIIAAAMWGIYLGTINGVGLSAISGISRNKSYIAAFFQFCLQPGAIFAFLMAGGMSYQAVLYLVMGTGILAAFALFFVGE